MAGSAIAMGDIVPLDGVQHLSGHLLGSAGAGGAMEEHSFSLDAPNPFASRMPPAQSISVSHLNSYDGALNESSRSLLGEDGVEFGATESGHAYAFGVAAMTVIDESEVFHLRFLITAGGPYLVRAHVSLSGGWIVTPPQITFGLEGQTPLVAVAVPLQGGTTTYGSSVLDLQPGTYVVDATSVRHWSAGDHGAYSDVSSLDFSLTPVTPCDANCDGSSTTPVLNVNDFLCFLTRFAASDPYANCDASTEPPMLNVNDFVCFMARFAAGC